MNFNNRYYDNGLVNLDPNTQGYLNLDPYNNSLNRPFDYSNDVRIPEYENSQKVSPQIKSHPYRTPILNALLGAGMFGLTGALAGRGVLPAVLGAVGGAGIGAIAGHYGNKDYEQRQLNDIQRANDYERNYKAWSDAFARKQGTPSNLFLNEIIKQNTLFDGLVSKPSQRDIGHRLTLNYFKNRY